MNKPLIEGGFYLKARKIQDSDISIAPPHVRETWDYILRKANHKDNKGVKKGSHVTSIPEIIEGLSWQIGYRKERYSRSQIENAMKWLRKAEMITTTKTVRGLIINVCNYSFYQSPKNYESRTDSRDESRNYAEMVPNDKQEWENGIKKDIPNGISKKETGSILFKTYLKNSGLDKESFLKKFQEDDKANEFWDYETNRDQFDVMLDWSSGNDKRRKDWVSSFRNWLRREYKGNKKERIFKNSF